MKVEGTFSSVTRGVSQQAPADRLEGQHGEVVNLLSDPVRGMVRRNGMIMEDQKVRKFTSDPSDALTDSFSYRAFSYRDGGQDYDILYRSRERVGNSDAHLGTLEARNKTAGTSAWVEVVRPAVDPILDLYEASGISAITSIGSYVLLAANGVAPSYNTIQGIDNLAWVGAAAVWVRGGGYARTYRVQAKRRSDGELFDVSYTTPAAAYPGVLNLSAIPPGSIGTPYEQYYVNELQAAYDTAVNQWSATASAAIVPSAIAAELITRLTSAGLFGWSLRGSHMLHDDIEWIEVSDGGNGDFMRAVLTDVKSVDDVTDIHRVGKVIRVQPSGTAQGESFYLKAYPKNEGNTDPFQTVIWREEAGVTQSPQHVFALGRIVGTKFYWASSPSGLDALILDDAGVVVESPTYENSTAGDLVSVRPPNFFGKRITMLTTFQDRLLIGSGGVVNASGVGDYFNFYRSTMLTVPASDPVELASAGTESDTIRTAVQYDRNLLIQGDKFHYAINGRTPLDASNPQMTVQFSLSGSAYAQPLGIGKYVYVLKEDSQLAASRLLQIQAGVYQDSPDLNDVSKQLRNYINGTPAEMVALTSPSSVFVRTEHFLKSQGGFPRSRPWGLYLYQYLDGDDGARVQEAWSAWEWSTGLGTPVGITEAGTGDAIYLYTIAFGADEDGDRAVALLVQKASARTDPTGMPYIDGMQVAGDAEATGLFTPQAVQAVRDVLVTSPGAAHSYSAVPAVTDADRFSGLEHPHYTVGDAPPETVDVFRWTGVIGWASDYVAEYPTAPDDNLWTGLQFPAFVDLTNPYVRDRDGKAKTLGELNLTSFKVTLTATAGFQSSWIDHDGTVQVDGFREEYSRIRYNQDVWIGRESKDVQVRLSAVDWLPLTINAIAWKGNWFAYQGN